MIISLTPLRAWLINSIPKSLKLGIGAGIGLFLALIGLEIMGVVGDHPVTLVTLGDIKNPLVLLRYLDQHFHESSCLILHFYPNTLYRHCHTLNRLCYYILPN